jgi:hypothetical protein
LKKGKYQFFRRKPNLIIVLVASTWFVLLILFFPAAGHSAAAENATRVQHQADTLTPSAIVGDPSDVPPGNGRDGLRR